MSARQTIIIIMCSNVMYDKKTRAILEGHCTNWTWLDLGKIILKPTYY